MFTQVTAVGHDERPFAVTVNPHTIKHIRGVGPSHPRVVLSMCRADSPEILHLPTTIAGALDLFPHLIEADEYSQSETKIVGTLLLNPATITTVRKVKNCYTIQFATGGPVTVLGIPVRLLNWITDLENAPAV